MLGSWHWIVGLAAVGLVLWLMSAGLVTAQVLIVGLAATVLVSYVAQNKGFGYHLGGLLPVLGLLVAVLVDRLAAWRRSAPPGATRLGLGLALGAALALIATGTASKLASLGPQAVALAQGRFEPRYPGDDGRPSWAEIGEMTRLIREGAAPEEPILQWGRLFEVGFLAERPSTLRFVSTPALGLLSDAFPGTEAWVAEVRRDLEAKRPAFVVIERQALSGGGAPYRARPGAPEVERIVVESLSGYETVFETPSTLVLAAR